MKITGLAIIVAEVPLRAPVAPYSSHLRTSNSTRNAIGRVETDARLVGGGEFNVNFRKVSAANAERQVSEWLLGRDSRNIVRFHSEWPFDLEPSFPLSVKSGVEFALWDIAAQAAGSRSPSRWEAWSARKSNLRRARESQATTARERSRRARLRSRGRG